MKISQIDIQALLAGIAAGGQDQITARVVDRLLFEGLEDAGESGDFALVFGSPTCTHYRAPKGAALVLQDRARFVLLSGGKQLPGKENTEAEAMRQAVLSKGVAQNQILLENRSMFTHENVEYSAEIMKQTMPHRAFRVLAVTSEYHMRRAMMNFLHYRSLFPQGTVFYPCPAPSSHAQRRNWFQTEKGREIVARECHSLYNYMKLGYLPDVEF